ncbi:MAG: OPT/YSL family transporter [Candidatus Thorarchaeota archaeon]|nr:MAG: OPT/YSL family transporter [Candidatus Thorarchaeota archaeon]
MSETRSSRALLAGLFFAGLLYILFVMAQGRWTDPAVVLGAIIEGLLTASSIVSGPVDKKQLGLLVLGASAYLVSALILGLFTEVVVMATVGILIYGAMKSEPKFPLTKRAIATGVVVGIIMTFLGIYIALKLGLIYFVGAEMLGALILGVHGKYTPEENTIVVSIANGSSMIAIGVLIVFPAIAIFEPPAVSQAIITYPFIAFITGVSAICGILLLAPLRERFEDEPWPQVRPQAECINALGADESAKMDVIMGMGAAGAWVGVTRIAESASGASLSTFPNALSPVIPAASAVPDWVGLSNSPLIASMGFFIGWKRALVLVAGSITSLLIWVILEGAASIEFGEHLRRPEILYLALGVFAAVIAGDILKGRKDELTTAEFEEFSNIRQQDGSDDFIMLEEPHKVSEVPRLVSLREEVFNIERFKQEIRDMVRDPREYLKTRRGQLPVWVALVSLGIFTIIGLLAFWFFIPFGGLQIHWALIVFGTPIVIVSAYFTARAISETGMLAGYISDMVAIPAILLFRVGFSAITVFMSMLGALQDSAIALLVHLKLGQLTNVRGRDIAKAVFVGAMLGTFVGSLITYTIYVTYNFGGTDFPSPSAQLFGFLVISLQGLGSFQLPGLSQFPELGPLLAFVYLFSFGVVGYLVGKELGKRGLSAISLAVGILIPPATSFAMLLGAFVDYRLKKQSEVPDELTQTTFCDPLRDRTTRLLSGVVSGEAVVTVIWVLYSAFAFLAL